MNSCDMQFNKGDTIEIKNPSSLYEDNDLGPEFRDWVEEHENEMFRIVRLDKEHLTYHITGEETYRTVYFIKPLNDGIECPGGFYSSELYMVEPLNEWDI